MNFDVHSDNIEIVKHETSVINLEEIDRIIDPRSLTKHKCVMNNVNEIHVATERCTFKRPAYLDLDRICLHYVMHYIKRYRGSNSQIYTYSFGCSSKYKSNPRKVKVDSQQAFLPLMPRRGVPRRVLRS